MIICRYGEIGLKGKNRNRFENKLVENLVLHLKKSKIKYKKITKPQGRILVYTNNVCTFLKNIPGIVSYSIAKEINLNLDEIKKEALKLYKKGSFRITTQRLNKILLPSQKLNEIIGEYIVKKTKAKVNLSNPDTEIFIEIINNNAYLFNKKIYSIGGLPVGISGLVTLLLENKDSITAGRLMMKRGCLIEIIKKKNIPYKDLMNYYPIIKLVKKPSKNSKAIISTEKPFKKLSHNLPILYPIIE